MTIPRRRLGTCSLEISTIGLGGWALGGDWAWGWGPQDDDSSIAAIRRALELGVNWIDTAPVYGVGHSESIIGRAIAQMAPGDRPFVFTKCGEISDGGDRWGKVRRDLRPETIRAEAEASLRRLGVERIDLFQFHWPDDGVAVEDSWGAMVDLQAAGKVREIGACNFNVARLERMEALRHVTSVQPPISLLRREALADVVPWAQASGTGVLAYSPMQSGLLTDSASAEHIQAMGAHDWRRGADEFLSPALERNLAMRDALRPIAAGRGTSVGAIAIAWVLAQPGVSGAIAGGRSSRQVEGWIDAGSLELSAHEQAAVSAALVTTKAGTGPIPPKAPIATEAG